MRRQLGFILLAAAAACSLLVDTEDLGGPVPSTPSLDGGDAGGAADDATADAAPTCVADLKSDGKHCGACGHDCLGGACVEARCQPAIFASVGDVGFYMASDKDALYVITLDRDTTSATKGRIVRVDKQTHQVVELVPMSSPGPFDIQVDAEYIYWTDATGTANAPVRRRSKKIENPEITKLGEANGGTELALVGNRIFVSGWDSAKMYTLPIGGGVVSEITGGGFFKSEGLAYDGTSVFVSSFNTQASARAQIVRIDANGTTGVVSHPNAWGRRITVAGDYLLGVANENLVVVKKAEGSTPRSFVLAKNSFPGGAIYDEHTKAAYLANTQGGTIFRLPGPDFLTLEPLVTNQSDPIALAVDERAIYWTLGAGAVGVLAK